MSDAERPLKDYEQSLLLNILANVSQMTLASLSNQATATTETPTAGTSGIPMQNNLNFAGEPQQGEEQQDFYAADGSPHSQLSQTQTNGSSEFPLSQTLNFASQPVAQSHQTMFRSPMQNHLNNFACEPQQQEQKRDCYATNGSSHSLLYQNRNFASHPMTQSQMTMYRSPIQHNLSKFAGEPQQQEQQKDCYATYGSSEFPLSQTLNFASQPQAQSQQTMFRSPMQNHLNNFACEPQQQEQQRDCYAINNPPHSQLSQTRNFAYQPMTQSQPTKYQSQSMMYQSQQVTPSQPIFPPQPMQHQQQTNLFSSQQWIPTQPQWQQQLSESGEASGEMWFTTSNGQHTSIPLDLDFEPLNPEVAAEGTSNELYEHHSNAQHGGCGGRSNRAPLLATLSGSARQPEMVSYVQEIPLEYETGTTRRTGIILTPTGERKVLVENDYITIPEGLELMNPNNYTESVILDLQASDTGTLNTLNLRNRACLGEKSKSFN